MASKTLDLIMSHYVFRFWLLQKAKPCSHSLAESLPCRQNDQIHCQCSLATCRACLLWQSSKRASSRWCMLLTETAKDLLCLCFSYMKLTNLTRRRCHTVLQNDLPAFVTLSDANKEGHSGNVDPPQLMTEGACCGCKPGHPN